MLPANQAVAPSLQPLWPSHTMVYCGIASAHLRSNRTLLWQGHVDGPSASSTLRATGLSVLSLRAASRLTRRLTVRAALEGTGEDSASQAEPAQHDEGGLAVGREGGEADDADAFATGTGRRRRRKVSISAVLSGEESQGPTESGVQESVGAGPTSTPSFGSPSDLASVRTTSAEAASATRQGQVYETQTPELVAAGATNAGLDPAEAASSTQPGGGPRPLPGSSSVAGILSALDPSNADASSSRTQPQPETSPAVSLPGTLVARDGQLSAQAAASEGQLAPAQAGEDAPSAQPVVRQSPGSNPVAARLRRSLFDALRSARAQHTEAGALRVMDAWWEPAHRSSASVDALLGAVVELGASEERKMLRQLLDWMLHVRRVKLPGTPAYNLLLRAAAGVMADGAPTSARGIRRVELLFQEMLKEGVPADEETLEILMGVYARAGQLERATAAHRLMMSSGLTPTTPVLQMLLKAYCSAKDFSAAQKVMWDLASADGGLKVEDMNLLLFALSREGRAEDIKALLDRVLWHASSSDSGAGSALEPAQGSGGGGAGALQEHWPQLPSPNSASLRALLRAYSSLGQHARAGEVLDLVKRHRVTPDPKLLAELVSAFAVSGSPTEAEATLLWAWGCGFLHLKADAKGAGTPRGGRERERERGGRQGGSGGQEEAVPLYTSLVYAYARQKLWAEALDVIGEMRRVMPSLVDERPYNVVMGEMASAGEAQRAQGMLVAMEAQGLPPKASSFRTLARAFCVAKLPEKAEDILLEMQQRGWRVSEDAVVPLLDAYALCRRPGEVERVVGNLDAFGLGKTPAIYTSLIGSFCLMGLPRAAQSVFSQAFPPRERRPTPLACAWLMAAHVALGNEEAALSIARLMESLGMPPPLGEFAQVVKAHVAMGKTKEARIISRYLTKMGLGTSSGGGMQQGHRLTRGLQVA